MKVKALAISVVLAAMVVAAAQAQDAQPAKQEIGAGELFTLRAWERMYKIMDGDGAGKELTVSFAPLEEEPGWVLTTEGSDAAYLKEDEDGNLLLYRLLVRSEDIDIRYHPPAMFLPHKFEPEVSYGAGGRVDIYDLESGELKHEGMYEHQVKRVVRANFDLPAGSLTGYLLEIRQDIELPMAKLSISLDLGLTRIKGLVYRRMKWRLVKLGLFGESDFRAYGLAE